MQIDQTVQRVKQDLLRYFGAIGAAAGRRFTIREFNLQVMMNVFAPAERAGLDLALGELVAARVLTKISDTEYVLAPEGLGLVSDLRAQTALEQQLRGDGKPRRLRPTSSRPPTTAPAAGTRSA